MRFSFVHAGDLRLDATFRGLGSPPASFADVLRDASLEAFDNLVALTIQRRAAFLVLCGDFAGESGLSLRARVRFERGVGRLAEHGIEVFVLDDVGHAAGPGGVTRLGAPGALGAPVEREGSRLATIHTANSERGEEPGFHVGVANREEVGDISDGLRGHGMDYWALGGHLEHQIVSEDPWVVFAGTPQSRGVDAAELGAKGVAAVTVENGAVTDLDFVPIDRVRVVRAVVEIPGAADARTLFARRLEELRREHADRELVVHGLLKGRPGRTGEADDRFAAAELERELRADCEGVEPQVWWDRIELDGGPRFDHDEIAQRSDFSSDLLDLTTKYADDVDGFERFVTQRTSLLEDRSIARHLPALSRSDRYALLERAEKRALRLLEEEGER